MSDALLTIREAATRLALGRTKVYELIAKRELKAIKIGRARRIPESALEEWIRQQVEEQDNCEYLEAGPARARAREGNPAVRIPR